MKLNLARPLAFVDLETTGTLPQVDRIVEITVLKIFPDAREELRRRRVNPAIPIPAAATAVHGISDDDVAGEPAFANLAKSLNAFLADCDIAGFNVRGFDLTMLECEFRRAGVIFSREGRSIVDAMAIFHEKERRDLAAAVRFYCDRDFPEAHSSEDDVRAAVGVLLAQLDRYPDLPRDVAGLHAICNPAHPDWIDPDGKFRWVDGVARIMFGKHSGLSLQELARAEPDYLMWMHSKDFSPELKQIALDALRGTFPTPPDDSDEWQTA